MSLVLFPQTIPPQIPHDFGDGFLTLNGGGPYDDAGREIVISARDRELYRASPVFAKKTWTEYLELYQFFLDMKGRYGTFVWYDWNEWVLGGVQWPKLFVCERDGIEDTYDLPFAPGATGHLIYTNGVGDLTGTITSGGGTDSLFDSIEFPDGGVEGDIVRSGAYGRRALLARIDLDDVSFRTFAASIQITGLPIIQAAAEA